MKRLFWLSVGIGLGVALTLRARIVVRRSLERYLPDRVARRLREVNAELEARRSEIRSRKTAPMEEAKRAGTV